MGWFQILLYNQTQEVAKEIIGVENVNKLFESSPFPSYDGPWLFGKII